jgi:predicted Rossmann-fold nucleotide-binding protein
MMVSHTRALVACPGGFGTCDELFEIMTLVQTGKHPRIPIVLFGKSYWDQVVNWEKMAEFVSNLAATLQHSRLAAGC